MKFELSTALEILVRTPEVLRAQLGGLSDEWLHADEGPGTWSPFKVVGHLIINEETNFLPRAVLILSNSEPQMLEAIDMTAHLQRFDRRKIAELLEEFAQLRHHNVIQLKTLTPSHEHLHKNAIHPRIGNVLLSQVLSTWVAHDLTHLGQISRVMARQYKEAIGPFIEFLPRLR